MQTPPEGAATPTPVNGNSAVCSAFGLRLEIDSRIDTSRLGLGSAGASGTPTRVVLDPEEVERRWAPSAGEAHRTRELREGATIVLTVDHAEGAGYLLSAHGVGRLLVSPDGLEVLCDPDPENGDWPLILPAQVLPLAATLSGREVLHAAGVVSGDQAILFSGHPGAGKSSLAAAMLRRGAELLSDDCIAIESGEEGLIAQPGAGLLYLRDEEHDRLSTAERETLGSASAFAAKQRYDPGVTATPAPFGALFLLERAAAGPSVERIEQVDPFALLAATFNLSVRSPERLERQLDLVQELAASGRVHRLRLLAGTDATQLAESVDAHLERVSR